MRKHFPIKNSEHPHAHKTTSFNKYFSIPSRFIHSPFVGFAEIVQMHAASGKSREKYKSGKLFIFLYGTGHYRFSIILIIT